MQYRWVSQSLIYKGRWSLQQATSVDKVDTNQIVVHDLRNGKVMIPFQPTAIIKLMFILSLDILFAHIRHYTSGRHLIVCLVLGGGDGGEGVRGVPWCRWDGGEGCAKV